MLMPVPEDRTFILLCDIKGTTAELKRMVADALAGRERLPEPDATDPPQKYLEKHPAVEPFSAHDFRRRAMTAATGRAFHWTGPAWRSAATRTRCDYS
jgi:hypothetical protein